jgi:hypothetical protein
MIAVFTHAHVCLSLFGLLDCLVCACTHFTEYWLLACSAAVSAVSQLRAVLPDFKRLLQESQFIGVSNYAR